MEKTSLQKSHSKSSNAKLTLVCLLLALFVGVFFVGLGLMLNNILEQALAITALAVGATGTILFLALVMVFKR